VEIARELISTQGYASTSISQIADKLGTSKAALYYHFKSKEEILDAMLEEPLAVLTELTDAASAAEPGKHAEQILGAMIDFVAGPCACFADFEKDPSIMQEYARRHGLHEGEGRLIAALVGPKPDLAKTIRAKAALAAAKQGTAAALELGDGVLTKSARAEILAAALRALG